LIKYKSTNSQYHIIGLIVTIIIAFPAGSFQRDIMENLDWKLQLAKRTAIVEQVKAGLLRPNKQGRYMLKNYSFLPISNDDNEIVVTKDKDGFTEVGFNIDHGFLDHYSSLIYTDRPQTLPYKNNNTVTTFDAHWYTVHF